MKRLVLIKIPFYKYCSINNWGERERAPPWEFNAPPVCLSVYICDCVCINQPFSTKVEFSAGAKVVNTLPFYAYISKSENPNNFTVESLNKKLKTSAYSVYKSLFNGELISEFIKCAIWLVYANMVTYIYISYAYVRVRHFWSRGPRATRKRSRPDRESSQSS